MPVVVLFCVATNLMLLANPNKILNTLTIINRLRSSVSSVYKQDRAILLFQKTNKVKKSKYFLLLAPGHQI